MIERGKFIVLYGANNLGKSHQSELLQQVLESQGLVICRLKYPIYDLEPTGPTLNAVLRHGLEMDELDVQKTYARNRRDFQPQLHDMLGVGTWVVAEDYTGTGIAWGMTRGLEYSTLEKMNRRLLKEDLAILLHGERIKESIEEGHRNETDDVLWYRAQMMHLTLADCLGWRKVFVDTSLEKEKSIEKVHSEIWNIGQDKFTTLQS